MAGGPFLLLVRVGSRCTEHEFRGDSVTIGRGRDVDLAIDDRVVSRKHCRLERLGSGFVLVDLGAQNRAKVRGLPVERAELRYGDSFTIGAVEIELAPKHEPEGSADETRHGDGPQSVRDLAALIGIARALNEEQELARLLTSIVDAAIQLSAAERGFLILGKGDETTVEVARNFAQEEVLSPEFKISRTLAQRVRETGVPELTTNAQEDQRFQGLASVADLKLRSVLCIPIRVRGEVAGVLYVDHRLQMQAFHEREKQLLMGLADQAGTAIHNARTLEALKSKQQELQAAVERIASLNASLKGQVAAQKAELTEIREELSSTRRVGRYRHEYSAIVGESRAMREVFVLLDKYIDSDSPVLILGESGTGKELVARAIWEQGPRKGGPFVTENCAALPESLLESELFGYAKGAFTGATSAKKGLFENATGGVLFLDEMGDMPLELQKKLLRVLQEGEVRPIGSRETIKVDVRLIAATNKNLEEMVREGDFREDLYYRLAVLPIRLPPLRERKEDIPQLVQRFLRERGGDGSRIRVSPDAFLALARYSWPGNVRELQNEIRRAALLCDGVILESHLSEHVRHPDARLQKDVDERVPAEQGTTLPQMVEALEMREIQKSMRQAAGNKSRAADMLGLSRFALQRKLEKFGLEPAGSPDVGPADGTPP